MARSHVLAWNMLSTYGIYKPYRHSSMLCQSLMEMLAGRAAPRIVIQMPPQHSKTLTTTEGLGTYVLGCNPDYRVGICSYSADLAEDFGFKNRQRMMDFGKEVFGVEVDPSKKSRGNWSLKGHPDGGMVAVGVGGPLSGKRLNFLICDDLLKNYEEAQSAYQRDLVWNWLVTVAFTRLTQDAKVCIIGTRWHPDDHIGRLIRMSEANQGEHYDIVSMPAIAERTEYMPDGSVFRQPGDPLCPELHDLNQLAEMKKYMTPYQWSALYQQDPTTPGGCHWSPDLFNERVIVDEWPKGIQHLVLALDPSSGKDQKHGDYPAICALGTAGNGLFYADFLMNRASPTIIAQELATYLVKLRDATGKTPDLMGVEKIGLWELYAEKLIREFDRIGIFVPLTEISHESRDKTLRIQRVDPYVSHREVRFIRSNGTLIALQQFRDFPSGRHDDACDAAEMAFRLLPRVAHVKAPPSVRLQNGQFWRNRV